MQLAILKFRFFISNNLTYHGSNRCLFKQWNFLAWHTDLSTDGWGMNKLGVYSLSMYVSILWIFVSHWFMDFFRSLIHSIRPQSFGNFPTSVHGMTFLFYQSVQQEFTFIPDNRSATYVEFFCLLLLSYGTISLCYSPMLSGYSSTRSFHFIQSTSAKVVLLAYDLNTTASGKQLSLSKHHKGCTRLCWYLLRVQQQPSQPTTHDPRLTNHNCTHQRPFLWCRAPSWKMSASLPWKYTFPVEYVLFCMK
jgi:hypothetical protein